MFRAFVLDSPGVGEIRELDDDALPDGDVTVAITCSGLNYKDGLAVTGAAPVVRSFPMVPGIDLAGTVTESRHPDFKPGDPVVLCGQGLSERYWGGYSQKQRVRGDSLLPLPAAFSPWQAMAIGTAGYTAMLSVLALEAHGVRPESGEILVTGAAGGVGGVAVALLAKLGYAVVAATGRMEESGYLTGLGATRVVDRASFAGPVKPLEKELWAGAVDSVGSVTLAHVLAQTRTRGTVAACGLAQGMDLPTSVAPFILRGVTLVGIDSVMTTKAMGLAAWERLAQDLDVARLEQMTTRVPLSAVPEQARLILAGQVRGRTVVDVNG